MCHIDLSTLRSKSLTSISFLISIVKRYTFIGCRDGSWKNTIWRLINHASSFCPPRLLSLFNVITQEIAGNSKWNCLSWFFVVQNKAQRQILLFHILQKVSVLIRHAESPVLLTQLKTKFCCCFTLLVASLPLALAWQTFDWKYNWKRIWLIS